MRMRCTGEDRLVAALHLRDETDMPHGGLHKAIGLGLDLDVLDEPLHPAVLLEIGVYEALGFAAGDFEVLGEPECGHAVHDSKVYGLCGAALVRCDHFREDNLSASSPLT